MDNLKELESEKLQEVIGGCSFAYDLGYALRILGLGLSGSRTPSIASEIANYNAYCDH